MELDGQIHLRQQEEDMIRTEHIEAYGFKVVRFTNEQVLERWEEVELELKKWLEMGEDHYSHLYSFFQMNIILMIDA